MPHRLIIAGGRDFTDYDLLCDALEEWFYYQTMWGKEIIVVSGAAKGADSLGERWAIENGHQVERYPADWNKDGKAAGPIRNDKMAKVADSLIAFWDGNSRGTKSMIDLARKRGLDVKVINYYT